MYTVNEHDNDDDADDVVVVSAVRSYAQLLSVTESIMRWSSQTLSALTAPQLYALLPLTPPVSSAFSPPSKIFSSTDISFRRSIYVLFWISVHTRGVTTGAYQAT